MQTPLINILVRTSRRPVEFAACIESVRTQTYKNIRLIVCTDDRDSLGYITANLYDFGDFGATVFIVTPTGEPYNWNFYCNNLKDKVEEGWFFYLDDDDTLDSPGCLQRMAPVLNLETRWAIVCQFKRGFRTKPDAPESSKLFISGLPDYPASHVVRGKIGGSCIFLHASQKNVASWDGKRAADYRFIKAVAEKLPLKFVPIVVVKAGNKGRHGK